MRKTKLSISYLSFLPDHVATKDLMVRKARKDKSPIITWMKSQQRVKTASTPRAVRPSSKEATRFF